AGPVSPWRPAEGSAPAAAWYGRCPIAQCSPPGKRQRAYRQVAPASDGRWTPDTLGAKTGSVGLPWADDDGGRRFVQAGYRPAPSNQPYRAVLHLRRRVPP